MVKLSILQANPKWNISLIMLFVLAIGSLIGLMSTNFVQDMISSTISLRDFYQSYYLTKWWIELWILAVNRYDVGFEDQLTGSELFLKDNLHCKKDCNISLSIVSRVRPTDDNPITFWSTTEPIIPPCSPFTKGKITLSGWRSYILPLFGDERKLTTGNGWFVNLLGNANKQYKLSIENANYWDAPNNIIWLWIILGSGFKAEYELQETKVKQELYITGEAGTMNIGNFLYTSKSLIASTAEASNTSIGLKFLWNIDTKNDNFNYLFINNLSENPYSFCLKAEKNSDGYVLDNATVTSIGSYSTTTIGLQANIRKPLPDYIINSYISDQT
jgi:hypothetical protein